MLLMLVIRSFALIHTYICRKIVDCLSRPYSHSSSRTFEEAYWISLWSDFASSKTFIIVCVLSWLITYISYMGALLLCLDLYIYLQADCWLSDPNFQPWFEWDLWGGVLNIPVVGFCSFKTRIMEVVLSWSIIYILYVVALLFCLDPYSYLRADCWLSDPTFQP